MLNEPLMNQLSSPVVFISIRSRRTNAADIIEDPCYKKRDELKSFNGKQIATKCRVMKALTKNEKSWLGLPYDCLVLGLIVTVCSRHESWVRLKYRYDCVWHM